MIGFALRNIKAYLGRLVLTFVVVMLGVAFVTASFTLTDSFTASFDKLFTTLGAGQDAFVGPTATSANQGPCGSGATIPQSALAQVRQVAGVQAAFASVAGCAQLVGPDGKAIAPNGNAPTLGNNWVVDPSVSPVRLAQGREPRGPAEVAVDVSTMQDAGLALGDKVKVLSKEPTFDATIVGTVRFGDDNFLLGASMTLFDLPTAQRVLAEPGRLSGIAVTAKPGVSQDALVADIKAALGPNFDVRSGEQQIQDNQDDLAQAFGFMNALLLAFAAIALFVAAFLIANTFAIIMAQRAKEFATMRSLGATRRRVREQVAIEAGTIGLVSGVLGFGLGIVVALLIYKLLAGLGLPDDGLSIRPRTFVVAVLVGLVVTTIAALVPAIRSSRIPPVEALKGTTATSVKTPVIRIVLGIALVALGALLFVSGTSGSGGQATVAVGVACALTFLGVFALSPLLVAPIAKALGLVLGRSTAGRIAVRNATRNPRRTAITAAALMIGTALVTLVTILGETVKSLTNDLAANTVTADMILENMNLGFSPAAAGEVAKVPGVAAATVLLMAEAGVYDDPSGTPPSDPASLNDQDRFDAAFGKKRPITGADLPALAQTLKLNVVAGSVESSGPGAVLSTSVAEKLGRTVGDQLTLYFDRGGKVTVPVVALVENNSDGISFLENITIDLQTYLDNSSQLQANFGLVRFEAGASPQQTRRDVETLLAERYPNIEVTDAAGFGEDLARQVDIVLIVITGMLAMSLFIAVLGIVNTLFLSSLERTREFGLLRAVGATKRSVRAIITLEAVIVALLGAILGISLGLIFALALGPKIFSDQGISALTIPWGSVIGFLIAAVIAGILASVLPAWRAGRLRLLDAIAYE